MEWKISDNLVDYEAAVTAMENRVADIIAGSADEMVWLLEHPPLYTAGTSAKPSDLIDPTRFPVFSSGRGGQFTYHGPGQRVGYVLLDLKKRAAPKQPDIRQFVQKLEGWLIAVLAELGIESFIRDGRVGVWCLDKNGRECKIAALGIRVKKWVTYHGICLNHSTDLSHYSGIVPCGINNYGVTSLAEMGVDLSTAELDVLLQKHFEIVFG
ncbi:MAG: lipoyl(octanoyl) transferase LipB [Alphaproteobacteria bacterium]|nr:lipoyl(octanoyl) transferase LipB [Alphaproteobacteria bacterium]